MASDFELTGGTQLAARLARLAVEAPKELARALYEEALVETKESMRRTPVDTGALRGSHVTERPVIDQGEISVAIRVGGPAAPYAVIVHEDLEADHPVGQAKFLESTILESAPFMGKRIADRFDLNRAAR